MFATRTDLRVLGIDPGLTRCGYGVVVSNRPKPTAIAAGVIRTPKGLPVPDRLAELSGEFEQLLDEFQPDAVVVEEVFFQSNVRTAMSVGQASGVALSIARRRNFPVFQYTPTQVKQSVTGSGTANKDQVMRMVVELLGLSSPISPPDAADALAMALTHLAFAPLIRRLDIVAQSLDSKVESMDDTATKTLVELAT